MQSSGDQICWKATTAYTPVTRSELEITVPSDYIPKIEKNILSGSPLILCLQCPQHSVTRSEVDVTQTSVFKSMGQKSLTEYSIRERRVLPENYSHSHRALKLRLNTYYFCTIGIGRAGKKGTNLS